MLNKPNAINYIIYSTDLCSVVVEEYLTTSIISTILHNNSVSLNRSCPIDRNTVISHFFLLNSAK